MKIPPFIVVSFVFLGLIFTMSACDIESDISTDPNARLEFSTDTLSFDTVFVTMGSITLDFKVYNRNAQSVKISNIRLAGNNDSPYRINLNGENGTEFSDVELWAGDSLHIFVEVTIDPNEANLPFVVEDSVLFNTNGNEQRVVLATWGQNAHFFGPNTANGYRVATTGDTTWTNDKPYVIYGGIEIAESNRLQIEAGTKVYIHNGGTILVNGQLQVNGGTDTSSRVIFQGTRLDRAFPYDYSEVPGQWFGIIFASSSNESYIRNALVQNAYSGITLLPDTLVSAGIIPDLVLENVVVRNMYAYGLWAMNSYVVGANCLVYNCGTYTALFEGCRMMFYSSTFGNMKDSYISPDRPAIYIDNEFIWGNTRYQQVPFWGRMANCIITGSETSIEDELELVPETGAIFDLRIENSLVKTKRTPSDTLINCTVPSSFAKIFVDTQKDDYSLADNSPALSIGNSLFQNIDADFLQISLYTDLKGNPRSEPWDVGAIER